MLGTEVNAEKFVIGCAMQSREASLALMGLMPEQMESERGRELLSAVQFLGMTGTVVDLVTLDAQSNEKHTKYLVESIADAPLPFQYPNYIAMLLEKARRRQVAAAATKLLNSVSDMNEDLDQAAGEFVTDLAKLASTEAKSISAQEATIQLVSSFDKKLLRRAMFGVGKLDEALGGMFGSKLIVVGARPATGKSALALCAALATQESGRVLFCSMEMSPVEIMGRAMANLSGVNFRKIAYRELDIGDFEIMTPHYAKAYGMDIHFIEGASTPSKVRAEALRLNKDGKLALIVVDYIQLMDSGKKAESRRVEVGQVSRELKRLAMEMDVPVLALSQLNRQSEITASKEPSMAELRESGDLEQDADVIVLMYVPPPDDGHVQQINAAGLSCVRLLLEKNRQGKSGQRVDTAFDGGRMRFWKVSDVLGEES